MVMKKKVLDNKKIYKPSPQLLILALTGKCNLDCIYCYASEQSCCTMSDDILGLSLDYIHKGQKGSIIQFTGGEPLLAWSQLVKAVFLMREKDIPCQFQLQTNGILLDELKVSFIKEHHIAVGISIDGPPIINHLSRPFKNQTDSTLATLQGIQLLKDANIEIGLTVVISPMNVKKLYKVIELAYYLGNVKQIGFNLMRPQGRGKIVKTINEDALVEGLQLMLKYRERWEKLTGKKIRLAQMDKIYKLQQGYKPFSHCYALHKAGIYVDPKGYLYSCASLSGQRKYQIGHVRTGIDLVKEAQLISDLQPVVRKCEYCSALSYCGGACYSRANEEGLVNPLECAMKRVFIEHYEMYKEF